jgi:hypothetical protein
VITSPGAGTGTAVDDDPAGRTRRPSAGLSPPITLRVRAGARCTTRWTPCAASCARSAAGWASPS